MLTMKSNHTRMVRPLLSVVIPAYNEEKYLGPCLKALNNQDLPSDQYEIIVVDNCSTDKTLKVAKRYGARVITEQQRGIIFAKGAGCAAARGSIIAITDADTIVPKTWLSQIMRLITHHPMAGITGPAVTQNLPLWGYLLHHGCLLIFILLARFNITIYLHGQNVAFYQKYYSLMGGFNPNIPIGEDEVGLLKKLRRFGEVMYCPSLKVKTHNRRYRFGFWVFLKEMLWNYFLGYNLNTLFNRTIIPPYRNIR